MTKPIVTRQNTIEQWRTHTNRISDNLGDPVSVYSNDVPDNYVGILNSNSTDNYTHAVDEIDAVVLAINDLNDRKVKRTGDTISGSLSIKQHLQVDEDTTLGSASDDVLTIKGTAVTIPNDLNFDSNTLFIDAANNRVGFGNALPLRVVDITGTLRATGNVDFTSSTVSTAYNNGALIVTGGVGIGGDVYTNGNMTIAGDMQIDGDDLGFSGATVNITNSTAASTANVLNTNVTTVNAFGAVTTLVVGADSAGTTTLRNYTTVIGNNSGGSFTVNTPTVNLSSGTTGVTTIVSTKSSTATSNGALVVNGGVGIGEKLFVSNDITTGTELYAPNVWSQDLAGGTLTIGANSLDTTGTVVVIGNTVTMSSATVVNVNGASPTLASSSTGTLTLFNTNLATVNAFGAATTVSLATGATTFNLGGSTGTATLNNITLTLPNATTINVNGVSPTFASTSTGTLSFFNTNILTVNEFGAATSITMGADSAGTTTLRNYTTTIGNISGGSFTVNTPTVNLSSGVAGVTSILSTLDWSGTTGSLTVSGGVHIAKKLNIGTSATVPIVNGQVATGGSLTLRANSTDLTGSVLITTNTGSTSTSTGALVISGGVGIGEKLYVSNLVTANSLALTIALPYTSGGTGTNAVPTAGGIAYGTGTTVAVTSAGTSGQIISSNAAGAPIWTTSTYPTSSTGSGKLLRSNGTNFIESTSTYPDTITSGQLLYASGSNAISGLALGTANKLLGMNNSANAPEYKSLTQGTGIIITHSTGDISIAASGVFPANSEVQSQFKVGQNAFIGSWSGAAHNNVTTGNALEIRPGSGVTITNLITVKSDTAGTNTVFNVNSSGDLAIGANKFTVAASTGNTNITGTLNVTGDTTINGNVNLGDSTGDVITIGQNTSFITASATTTSTSESTIAQFSGSTYRSAEFYVQATSSSGHFATRVLAIHDSANINYTEYGRVELGTTLHDGTSVKCYYSGGIIYLKVTPSSTTSTTWRTVMTLNKV